MAPLEVWCELVRYQIISVISFFDILVLKDQVQETYVTYTNEASEKEW